MIRVRDDSEPETFKLSRAQVNGQENPHGATLILPIFPSPNVVLFPKVHLPLRVVEPRYRRMVQDAMAGDRLIGMVVMRAGREENRPQTPDLYALGCAGEIVNATALPDGRYQIVLYGYREFEIRERLAEQNSYLRAQVAFREHLAGPEPVLPAAVKDEILSLMEEIVGDKQSDLVKMLRDSALGPETWVNLCCFSLPFSSLEKMSLLEAKSLAERAGCLVNVLHFRAFEKRDPFEHLRVPKGRKARN